MTKTETYSISDTIKKLRETKKRNFIQSFDLIVNLKNIDLKKPENKISKDIVLSHGRGKEVKVCIISENVKPTENYDIVNKKTVEEFTDKKKASLFVKKYEFFVCEAPLMPLVGKILGKYMGPKGKMPKLLPPNANPEHMVQELKRSVRIRIRDSPVIHTLVGSENMEDEHIKENIEKLIDEIKKFLPKGRSQIKNIYLKLTMSNPAKINF